VSTLVVGGIYCVYTRGGRYLLCVHAWWEVSIVCTLVGWGIYCVCNSPLSAATDLGGGMGASTVGNTAPLIWLSNYNREKSGELTCLHKGAKLYKDC
jgi:hypothetical protein